MKTETRKKARRCFFRLLSIFVALGAMSAETQAVEIEFSQKSTTFFDAFELTLRSPSASHAGEIHYTLNESAPKTNSARYGSPLKITNSVTIRAQAFEPGYLPGPVRTESFVKLSSDMRTVTSDLPLILVHGFGGNLPSYGSPASTVIFVHEPVRGRASFTNAPDQAFRAGLSNRGSQPIGVPKFDWFVDIWDEKDEDFALPILGMPAAKKWVFHAPYSFDPSLFHNPLASELSNKIGRYAPRYRFAEVYLNEHASGTAAATLTPSNYLGVYNILEQINIGPDRVHIDKLTAADLNLPEVTGGYLMALERVVDPGFNAGGQYINYVDPSYNEISSPERDPQKQYINAYMNAFGDALNSEHWTNPVTGYLPYIDRGSWIDHHLLNVLAFNVGALRLSCFFYKQRTGPIVLGPVWDFARAFGSTDGRDENPFVWKSHTGDGGTDFFNHTWWDRMFRDPSFWQAYIDRWQELREGIYSDGSVFGLMDHLNDQVKESAERDHAKWNIKRRGGSQETEVAYFKSWLRNRMLFMDTNFLAKPHISLAGGQVTSGTQITLTGPPGARIYYTLDGTDPRVSHGGIDARAQVYDAPITVSREVRLVARCRSDTHYNLTGASNPPISSPWSGPARARYTLEALALKGDLILNELNYRPSAPTPSELARVPTATADSFEFIELKNVSDHSIDLLGSRFTSGITFTFDERSSYHTDAGGFLLLVKNRDAFVARYGESPRIAGVYSGALNDAGDSLRLEDAFSRELLALSYSESVQPAANGFGFTLVRADETAGNSPRNGWAASAATGGSPGAENPPAPDFPVIVVNEVLAGSEKEFLNGVELFNMSPRVANIGGWFITNDRSQPKKLPIPAGTVIPAGRFLVFAEGFLNSNIFDTNAFLLSKGGGEVWIFAADATGELLGYSHGFSFGISDTNTSFGRFLLTTGQEVFVPQQTLTLGLANGTPKVGPLVIREIHYHPVSIFANAHAWDNTDDEFIELQNISALPVSLSVSALNAVWRVRGNVEFDFPGDFVLTGGETAVLVGFDPRMQQDQEVLFRNKFSVPGNVRLLGPLKGHLPNTSGSVGLFQPIRADAVTGEVTYFAVDQVDYADESPWPPGADGTGASLQRRDPSLFGDDPSNWVAALATPGGAFVVGDPPTIAEQPQSSIVIGSSSVKISVLAAGSGPLYYLWKANGTSLEGSTNATLILSPARVADSGSYSVLVANASGSTESAQANVVVMSDADGDGMGDPWELENGFSPSYPSDATQDDDHDGFTNLQEFLAGTNPKDDRSLLKIDSASISSNGLEVAFIARSHRSYTVQFREAIPFGKWQTLGQLPGRSHDQAVNIADTSAGSSIRFYRVVTPQEFNEKE